MAESQLCALTDGEQGPKEDVRLAFVGGRGRADDSEVVGTDAGDGDGSHRSGRRQKRVHDFQTDELLADGNGSPDRLQVGRKRRSPRAKAEGHVVGQAISEPDRRQKRRTDAAERVQQACPCLKREAGVARR